VESYDALRDDPMKCNSLNSTLRTTLATTHVSDTDWVSESGGDFGCNGDFTTVYPLVQLSKEDCKYLRRFRIADFQVSPSRSKEHGTVVRMTGKSKALRAERLFSVHRLLFARR